MKIYDLPEVDELDPNGFIEITNANSTTSGLTNISDYFYTSIEEGVSERESAHRNHFRGKNLGMQLTSAQYAAILNGSFTDIWVGDYWKDSDGMVWRVVDIDYYMNVGDPENTKHHILVMPDLSIYKTAIDETESYYASIGTGSWPAVKFLTDMPAKTKAIADKVFLNQGSLGPTYLDIMTTNTSSKDPTYYTPLTVDWTSSSVKLPNQMMLAASLTNTASITTKYFNNRCSNNRQLALFKITGAEYLKTDDRFWIQDMIRGYGLVYMGNGYIGYTSSRAIDDVETGIRPIIIIG